MLRKLFPKERDFFPLFKDLTSHFSDAVFQLVQVLEKKERLEVSRETTKNLKIKSEEIARTSILHLYETFVTPFDRRHIFTFVIQLAEMTALVDLVAKKLQAFEIQELPDEVKEIIVKTWEGCSVLKQMVNKLQNLKYPQETLSLCLQIYKIHAESENLHFKSNLDLYQSDLNALQIIKIKDVSNDILSLTSKLQNLSFLVEEIILEYA
jgi:uncharacterized protein Yka (UPF0111/DUF47 family)